MEHAGPDVLGRVQADEGLRESVDARVADRADLGPDLFQLKMLGEHDQRVLPSRAGVSDQLALDDRAAFGVPPPDRSTQRGHDQGGVRRRVSVPGNDALCVHVEDERDIHNP